MNLNKQVAIVTGGASGFGAAIARRLSQAGAAVLVAALAVWLTRAALARETSSPVPALGTTARAML